MPRRISFLICAVVAWGEARAATPPTIRESVSLKSVGSPRLSPDGSRVAYELWKTS